MSATKEVKVTKLAVYQAARVRPGQILHVPVAFKATWCAEVKKAKKAADEPEQPSGDADLI